MLVCFGDSLTASDDAWPTLLDLPTVNVAVVGAVFSDLAGQLSQAPDGDAAAVTIGTNDTLRYETPLRTDVLLRAASELQRRYERVALIDVLPPWKPRPIWLRDLGLQRRAVRSALTASDLPVLRPGIPPWGWRRDGIHLNGHGQRRVAAAVERWLTS